MEKITYTEYHDVIKPENDDIEVIVQIPSEEQYPVNIRVQSDSRWMTFAEWTGINESVHKALADAGWTETAQ